MRYMIIYKTDLLGKEDAVTDKSNIKIYDGEKIVAYRINGNVKIHELLKERPDLYDLIPKLIGHLNKYISYDVYIDSVIYKKLTKTDNCKNKYAHIDEYKEFAINNGISEHRATYSVNKYIIEVMHNMKEYTLTITNAGLCICDEDAIVKKIAREFDMYLVYEKGPF